MHLVGFGILAIMTVLRVKRKAKHNRLQNLAMSLIMGTKVNAQIETHPLFSMEDLAACKTHPAFNMISEERFIIEKSVSISGNLYLISYSHAKGTRKAKMS